MDNKKLKSSWAAAFTVASVWFGTHVGAGFATGNQVVNYFVQYGWTAAIFPLLAMGILAVVMYIMMKFAKLNGFDNYKDTYRALYPKPWMEIFFEIFYIIIILAAVASCVDGAGGIVKSLIDLPDIICNLVIIALLILLSIFGVDLIIKASTVLSTAILIVTAILVIMGFVVPIDAVAQELATENAAYASIPAIADVTSQKGLEGVWRGVFVYAAFQCVSVPAMIAASTELTHKGVKRASILGWLMNGGALAASGAMLLRWYPVLCAIKSVGVDSVASIAARHIADVMKLPNQSVVTLMGSGYTWLFVVYTILLFCAFVSTSVTLVYSMIQRFEGHCFPKAIKSKAVRSVIVGLIVIGLWFAPGPMINGFNKFGTGVTVVITVLTAIAVFQQITGIMFPVFDVMSTVDPDLGMTPLNNGLLVCGQIGIVLIGAFPMVEWITRTFGGALSKLGGALGMNDKGSAGLVATLANNIAMFNIMGEMNPKGKILNVAFAVSAAFVFGDHLGFAAGNDAQMIFPMIAGKLVAGVTALIVANLLAPKLLSKIQTISK